MRNLGVVVLALWMFGCGGKHKPGDLKVTGSPTGQVDGEVRMVFAFSRAMVKKEHLGVTASAPIVLTPALAHEARWTDDKTLVVVPTASLPLSTKFTAVIPGETKALDGSELGTDTSFEFFTERLTATADVVGSKSRAMKDQLVRLSFSQQVAFDEVANQCAYTSKADKPGEGPARSAAEGGPFARKSCAGLQTRVLPRVEEAGMALKLSLLLIAMGAGAATAQPGNMDPLADGPAAEPTVVIARAHPDPLATTERWGGGLRLTGASGIGALPGRNFGAEVAVNVRHDELFAELALSHWQPENDYRVMSSGTPIPLGLELWAARAGWSSMRMPLRAWLLAEVGEVGGTSEMSGVLPRMVMGNTPEGRRWTAVGAGVGVAWPLSNQIRLVGSMELAIPISDEHLVLDNGVGDFKPDPLAARYAVGLEVGWR